MSSPGASVPLDTSAVLRGSLGQYLISDTNAPTPSPVVRRMGQAAVDVFQALQDGEALTPAQLFVSNVCNASNANSCGCYK